MSSKLGTHHNFVTQANAMRDFILNARPAVVKTLHHDPGFWGEIKEEYPDLILVGRKFFEHQDYDNPENNADEVARRLLDMRTSHICDYWEGYNEPDSGHVNAKYCRFEVRLAGRLHDDGVKYLAKSSSVGTPPIEEWTKPENLDVLRVADAIGVHEYCAPRMDSEFLRYPNDPDIQPEVGGYFTLRYRKWWPTLPADCRKPVIISECGIDSGAAHWDPGGQGGWRSFTDAAGYKRQLEWYDGFLQEDEYVKGATIFCWGTLDPTWDTFDISGEMKDRLAEYIIEQRTEPEPGDVDDFERWLGQSAFVQSKVIPYNPEAMFRKVASQRGWSEAMSGEVDLAGYVPSELSAFDDVRCQVFLSHEGGVDVQNIIWCHIGDWQNWRVVKRRN